MSTFLTLQQAPNAGAITASLYLDQTFVGVHLNEVFSLSVSLNPVGTVCSVITNVGNTVDPCPSAMGLMAGTQCFSVACAGDPSIIKASAMSNSIIRPASLRALHPTRNVGSRILLLPSLLCCRLQDQLLFHLQ
ncbi:hypothetical protein BCR33DRAFT_521137 [Rhizoclosmatium globosum]|uniref:Uncharacterized protein n=1 Tax=Rhizoclosmatium globosum TaxID=329046 RepID=A0A1Y2BEI2_9FUNG|nr:hypothetical protein BCR33DRAFT_521137 [Rhizoclosmatium globosum]|eukprot:ORY33231.1 hypothetical protein BCR33DRAFT_521137 [Rhizoclosmatium globosum]